MNRKLVTTLFLIKKRECFPILRRALRVKTCATGFIHKYQTRQAFKREIER